MTGFIESSMDKPKIKINKMNKQLKLKDSKEEFFWSKTLIIWWKKNSLLNSYFMFGFKMQKTNLNINAKVKPKEIIFLHQR